MERRLGIVAVASVLAVTGCGGDDDDGDTPATSDSAAATTSTSTSNAGERSEPDLPPELGAVADSLEEAGFRVGPAPTQDAVAALAVGDIEITLWPSEAEKARYQKVLANLTRRYPDRLLAQADGLVVYFLGKERPLTPDETENFRAVFAAGSRG